MPFDLLLDPGSRSWDHTCRILSFAPGASVCLAELLLKLGIYNLGRLGRMLAPPGAIAGTQALTFVYDKYS